MWSQGMFYCVRAELNNMQGAGSIVCTTSVQGLIGFPMTAAYSITKHGIVGMVKAAAKEVGEKGIRVNAIAPYVTRIGCACMTKAKLATVAQ